MCDEEKKIENDPTEKQPGIVKSPSEERKEVEPQANPTCLTTKNTLALTGISKEAIDYYKEVARRCGFGKDLANGHRFRQYDYQTLIAQANLCLLYMGIPMNMSVLLDLEKCTDEDVTIGLVGKFLTTFTQIVHLQMSLNAMHEVLGELWNEAKETGVLAPYCVSVLISKIHFAANLLEMPVSLESDKEPEDDMMLEDWERVVTELGVAIVDKIAELASPTKVETTSTAFEV